MNLQDIVRQMERIDEEFAKTGDADMALVSYRILGAKVLGQYPIIRSECLELSS